ncbi:RNA-binding domain-containing protein [Backusella circina FSU 941]|nr:RNA-binding domain-containing protein [Backusella circina FSU 941]
MADPSSPPPVGNRTEDFPPPPPPLGRRSPGDRSLSPPRRRRSPSGGRYYDDRRSYREDYGRGSRHSDRYEPRRDYHRDRYDRYDHRDRYDRYDDRRGARQRPRNRKPVDRGNEQERKNSTTIYCGNLPYDFLDRDVHDMFETFGRIKSITIPMDNVTSKNKGFAFIEFEDRRDAEDAFGKYDGFSVEGRRLRLDW